MKVYIVVPVFNTEKYLERCLDSIFAQTYSDIEVVCVNDGSTDNSLNVLNKYKANHPNMVLVSKENGGLSSARNAALNIIENFDDSLITFIDSDDYISNNFVDNLVSEVIKNDCDIVCSSFYIVSDGDVKKTKHEVPEKLMQPFDALNLLFEGNIQSHCPCKIYKGKLWKDLRFDESLRFMEDQAIMYQLFLKSKSILLTNWAGYFIELRQGSLCQSKMTNSKILCAMKSYQGACLYPFNELNDEQAKQIKLLCYDLYARIFLMMYPRFNSKHALSSEKSEWAKLLTFAKENKVVRKFKPTNKKEKIKKFIFLYFKCFYKILFSFFLKKYDKE